MIRQAIRSAPGTGGAVAEKSAQSGFAPPRYWAAVLKRRAKTNCRSVNVGFLVFPDRSEEERAYALIPALVSQRRAAPATADREENLSNTWPMAGR